MNKLPLPDNLLNWTRQLRTDMPDAEHRLWFLLRDRRFQGIKFRRQHAVLDDCLDFYCAELKLAVELDGGQHNADAHRAKDEHRSAALAGVGIAVVRYWNHEVMNNIEGVLSDLLVQTEKRRTSLLSLLPLGRAERGGKPSTPPNHSLLPPGEGPGMRGRRPIANTARSASASLTLNPLPEGEGKQRAAPNHSLLPPGEGSGMRGRRPIKSAARADSAPLTPTPLPKGEGFHGRTP